MLPAQAALYSSVFHQTAKHNALPLHPSPPSSVEFKTAAPALSGTKDDLTSRPVLQCIADGNTARSLCVIIIKTLSDPASPSFFHSSHQVRWMMEGIIHAFMLPLEDSDVIEEAIAIYSRWILATDPSDCPPPLQENEEFITDILRHLSLVFIDRLLLSHSSSAPLSQHPISPSASSFSSRASSKHHHHKGGRSMAHSDVAAALAAGAALERHVRLCRSVLDVYSNAGKQLLLSRKGWLVLLNVILSVADALLVVTPGNPDSASASPLSPSSSSLGNALEPHLVRVVFDLWIRSRTYDKELWKYFFDLSKSWMHRRQFIVHWKHACLGFCRRVSRILTGEFNTSVPVVVEWPDGTTTRRDFTDETTLFYWFQLLHAVSILPSPSPSPSSNNGQTTSSSAVADICSLCSPRVHLALADGYAAIALCLLKEGCASSSSIMDLLGAPLFALTAICHPKQREQDAGYQRGCAAAIAAICRVFCESNHHSKHRNRRLSRAHLTSFYAVLAKLLRNFPSHSPVIEAIFCNCNDLFISELPDVRFLVPFFIPHIRFLMAPENIQGQCPTGRGDRSEHEVQGGDGGGGKSWVQSLVLQSSTISIIVSLLCLNDRFTPSSSLSLSLEAEGKQQTTHSSSSGLHSPRRRGAENSGQYELDKMRSHLRCLSKLLMNSLSSQTEPPNIEMTLWSIFTLLFQASIHPPSSSHLLSSSSFPDQFIETIWACLFYSMGMNSALQSCISALSIPWGNQVIVTAFEVISHIASLHSSLQFRSVVAFLLELSSFCESEILLPLHPPLSTDESLSTRTTPNISSSTSSNPPSPPLLLAAAYSCLLKWVYAHSSLLAQDNDLMQVISRVAVLSARRTDLLLWFDSSALLRFMLFHIGRYPGCSSPWQTLDPLSFLAVCPPASSLASPCFDTDHTRHFYLSSNSVLSLVECPDSESVLVIARDCTGKYAWRVTYPIPSSAHLHDILPSTLEDVFKNWQREKTGDSSSSLSMVDVLCQICDQQETGSSSSEKDEELNLLGSLSLWTSSIMEKAQHPASMLHELTLIDQKLESGTKSNLDAKAVVEPRLSDMSSPSEVVLSKGRELLSALGFLLPSPILPSSCSAAVSIQLLASSPPLLEALSAFDDLPQRERVILNVLHHGSSSVFSASSEFACFLRELGLELPSLACPSFSYFYFSSDPMSEVLFRVSSTEKENQYMDDAVVTIVWLGEEVTNPWEIFPWSDSKQTVADGDVSLDPSSGGLGVVSSGCSPKVWIVISPSQDAGLYRIKIISSGMDSNSMEADGLESSNVQQKQDQWNILPQQHVKEKEHNMSVTQCSRAGSGYTFPIIGPLLHNSFCSRSILAPMIRQTAINASRRIQNMKTVHDRPCKNRFDSLVSIGRRFISSTFSPRPTPHSYHHAQQIETSDLLFSLFHLRQGQGEGKTETIK